MDNGSSWNTNKPEWLKDFTTTGDGSLTSKLYTVALQPQTAKTINEHNDALQAATNINTTSGYTPYNLSNSTGGMKVENTANCYVINAPGKYSFPLVYGNAITNGEAYEKAYKSDITGIYVLKTLVNHLGKGITDPYIAKNDGCTPASATLLWQDRKDLVTNVALEDGVVTFEVPSESIGQGNALIAVKNAEGQILWSWHIWVTDYVLGNDAKNVNADYWMLPIPLGWCDGEDVVYDERSVLVRFVQKESGEQSQIMTVTQQGEDMYITGYAPSYQFGRKDPLIPAIKNQTNHTWYDAEGKESTELPTMRGSTDKSTKVLAESILNPEKYILTYEHPYRNVWSINFDYYDNFDAGRDVEDTDKTIYEPSPAGYKIPVIKVFENFSADRGKYDAKRQGWEFEYVTGKTIFLPGLGSRNWVYNGAVYDTWGSGYTWSSLLWNPSNGYYFRYWTDVNFVGISYNYMPYAYAVFLVKD